jgi:hypothetical protein
MHLESKMALLKPKDPYQMNIHLFAEGRFDHPAQIHVQSQSLFDQHLLSEEQHLVLHILRQRLQHDRWGP